MIAVKQLKMVRTCRGLGDRSTLFAANSVRGLVVLFACASAGCTVGPDFVRPGLAETAKLSPLPIPQQTASAPTAGGSAQAFSSAHSIPQAWWSLFHSPSLDRLVNRAIEHSPTLQAAQAALRVAQENSLAQQGAYYPSIVANLSPTRQRSATGSLSSPVASGETVFNLHTAQVTVGYTFDVFGANRRQVESLDALADGQRFQLEAAWVTLTSNLIVTAIQQASLLEQIQVTEHLVSLQQEQLDLFKLQLKAGAIAESNIVAQASTVALTRAVLPPLRKQLAQQRDALIALVGELPGQSRFDDFELATLELPLDLPITLPSDLVQQRPDVQAAEAQLHAASAQIGVASANMLPQFTLGADAGSVATAFSQLFKSGTGFWSLAGSVTQPLFDGGTLLHRRRAATAAYDEAEAQYRGTVVLALQNVADTLQALQFDADALREAADAEELAASSLTIARRQLELGDASYLAILAADQAYAQAEIGLTQARANRFADTAALFQALGGGWWDRAISTAR